jgi:chemotaxis response regulator CheB
MTRILLADDHTIVRQGLKLILASQSDLSVVGEAANGREVVELAQKLKPDVVLLDVAMPELNGIEATKQMMQANPRLRILVLSMHKEAVYVRARSAAADRRGKDQQGGRREAESERLHGRFASREDHGEAEPAQHRRAGTLRDQARPGGLIHEDR